MDLCASVPTPTATRPRRRRARMRARAPHTDRHPTPPVACPPSKRPRKKDARGAANGPDTMYMYQSWPRNNQYITVRPTPALASKKQSQPANQLWGISRTVHAAQCTFLKALYIELAVRVGLFDAALTFDSWWDPIVVLLVVVGAVKH